MPRFAANLSMLFTEYPFVERFDRAAASGFEAVEFLFPYDEDIPAIRDALQRNGLTQVLFNLPAGDFAKGVLFGVSFAVAGMNSRRASPARLKSRRRWTANA